MSRHIIYHIKTKIMKEQKEFKEENLERDIIGDVIKMKKTTKKIVKKKVVKKKPVKSASYTRAKKALSRLRSRN